MNHIFMISRLASSIQSFQKGDEPHPRHFDRSGAEWRNLLPLMVQAALRREISRLRVSSKRFPSAPYRHAAPLEMTVLASSIQSFQKGTNLILVISTVAQRSGEISFLNNPGSMEEGDLSAQSIMGAFPICLSYRHAAPLEMTLGSPLPSWNQNKDINKEEALFRELLLCL